MTDIKIYTDGACSPNPGFGGWGAILVSEEHNAEKEISGGAKDTTNNRMELMAIIEALRALKGPSTVTVYSDSKYVVSAFTDGWIVKWKKKKWRTSSGSPVKSKDLWEVLDILAQRHNVTWEWVRGHSGHEMNERADVLAVKAREKVAAESV